ncbi:MAG: O-antigen ligase family protein [Lachnospiraceae bacterium]|nr:O-antigen ligase family protein [Lachnospiraceae bacterium]
MWVYLGILALYLGTDIFFNFFYHHYYWELFHKAAAFLLLPILWYMLPEGFFERNKVLPILLGIIVFSCIVSIILYYIGIDRILFGKASLIPQIVRHGEATTYWDKRLTFTYPHKSEYGVFLVLYTGLCLKFKDSFKKKFLCYGSVFIMVFTAYLTNSVATLVCVAVVIVGYILSRLPWKRLQLKYKISLAVVSLVMAGLLAAYGYHYVAAKRDLESMGSRFPIWKASIAAILDNPAGIGMNFNKLVIWDVVTNCHNVFLVEMLRYSIPVGILLIVLFLTMILRSFWKYFTFSAAIWVGLLGMLCIDYSLKEFDFPMVMICLFLLFFMKEEKEKQGNIETRRKRNAANSQEKQIDRDLLCSCN